MEWVRIREAMGEAMGEQGAFAAEMNSHSFIAQMLRLFPDSRAEMTRAFPMHRPHLRLATRVDGSCVFLGPQGCGLEREARPYYCRLFPLWVKGGRVVQFNSSYCLALKQGRTEAGVLKLIGASAAEMLWLHGRLRLAWGLTPQETSPHPTDASADGGNDTPDSD